MSSLIRDIQRSLQYAVSGDKYRYREGGWDLDLTYITPRVIAMGIPGDGVSVNWRNNIKDVSEFFAQKHFGHFKIFNLSGEPYNYYVFENRVSEFAFPDHHPPPLDLYLRILMEMHAWLLADPQNVVAVHCLAGRSRTGTIISGYLLYSSFSANALQAISYFNTKRSLDAKDVCLPSQIRYVGYMDALLQDHNRTALSHPTTRILRAVIISPPFRLEGSVDKGNAKWRPSLRLQHQALPQEIIFRKTYPTVGMFDGSVRLEVPNIPLQGDVLLKLSHIAANPITYGRCMMKIQKVAEAATSLDADLSVDIARISFNTSFLEGNDVRFESFEIDAHKAGPIARDSKYIPTDVSIVLEFEALGSPSSSKYHHVPSSVSPNPVSPRLLAVTPLVAIHQSPSPSNQTTSETQGLRSPHLAAHAQHSPSGPSSPVSPSYISPTSSPRTFRAPAESSAVTRPRNRSDPSGLSGGVTLASGHVVYPHDALVRDAASQSPNGNVAYVSYPNQIPQRATQPVTQPVNYALSNAVIDGSAAGFHGVKVSENQMDAIAEFKKEQELQKQAILAAHAATAPVRNVYMPTSPQPVYAAHHSPNTILQRQISPGRATQPVNYAIGPAAHHSVQLMPATTSSPTSSPGRRRPTSVHYGAIPTIGVTPASPTYSAPVAVFQPIYSPTTNPYIPIDNPYAATAPPSNPYQVGGHSHPNGVTTPTVAAVPEGWPPGYAPPQPVTPSSSNPYAPNPTSPNPYANYPPTQ